MSRLLPLTFDALTDALRTEDVFNSLRYLDADAGSFFEVAEDVLDYCRGNREGTDLQLSDTFALARAQAIAEEEAAQERGYDEDGLPVDPGDRRFFPIPCLGEVPASHLRQAVEQWLQEFDLRTEE